MAQTLSDAIAWWARVRPEQKAIIMDGEPLSYRAYKAWSDRVAAMLIADGLQPGERVGVCDLNSLAYWP